LAVYLLNNASFVPLAGYPGYGTTLLDGQSPLKQHFIRSNPQWTTESIPITIPASTSPTVKRLVFFWKNDNDANTQPPAAIDEIVVYSTDNSSNSVWNITLEGSLKGKDDDGLITFGYGTTVTTTANIENEGDGYAIRNGFYDEDTKEFLAGGNMTIESGTIIGGVYNGGDGILTINGGNISNSNVANATVTNGGDGTLTIYGGTISANAVGSPNAVGNWWSGITYIIGGTITGSVANGTEADDYGYKGVIIRWNGTGTEYTLNTTTDIIPTNATAKWIGIGAGGGISWTSNTGTARSGTILVPGITVQRITPTCSFPIYSSFSYGQMLSALTPRVGGSCSDGGTSVPGTFTFDFPSTRPDVATDQSFPMTFNPDDPASYYSKSGSASLTVTQSPELTIVGTIPDQSFEGHSNMGGAKCTTIEYPSTCYSLSRVYSIPANTVVGTIDYKLSSINDPGVGIFKSSTIGDPDAPYISGTNIYYTASGNSGTATISIDIVTQNFTTKTLTLKFTSTKRIIYISGLTVNDVDYTGAKFDEIPGGITGTATVTTGTHTGTLDYLYSGDYISGTTKIAPTNAGSYKLTVQVPDDDDIFQGSRVYSFSIKRINPEVPTGLTATVGQILSDINLPAGWEWGGSGIDRNSSVGEVGTQVFKAFYTPVDSNHNALTNVNLSVNVVKASGANVPAPVSPTVTSNSIVIPPVLALTTGQQVQYTISTTNPADASAVWQSALTFGSLIPETTYYIFARSVENKNYTAGAISPALAVKTSAAPITPITVQIVSSNNITQVASGLTLSAKAGATVKIYSLKGNLISSQSYESGVYSVSLKHLPKGMYVVKASFGSETKVLRIPVM